MDNERYARYLSEDSEWGSGQSSGEQRGPALTSLSGMLSDAKKKLGLGGLSNRATVALIVCAFLLCAFAVWSYSPGLQDLVGGRGQSGAATLVKADEDQVADGDDSESVELSGGTIYVHVSGAVQNPGVYELMHGSRAVDALNAAGGFLDDGAREAVNLAATLEDGMQLHVLTQQEFDEQGGLASLSAEGQVVAGGGGGGHDSAGLVNLNIADSAILQTLPGIGPVTADNIIQDREANGPYSSLEDLTRVSGIGPKRVEALQGVASVGN